MPINTNYTPVIPEGGCVKFTECYVGQVFDSQGRLVSADCEAGTHTVYMRQVGEVVEGRRSLQELDQGDGRLDNYYPFVMVTPQVVEALKIGLKCARLWLNAEAPMLSDAEKWAANIEAALLSLGGTEF